MFSGPSVKYFKMHPFRNTDFLLHLIAGDEEVNMWQALDLDPED